MRCKKFILAGMLLCFWLSAYAPAWALLAGNDFFGFDFRFSNPGARANAMGGAFIAVADDATAAYTNPAGLTILTEPEISIEFKYTETTNRVYDEVGPADYDNDVFGVSFISFAYPSDRITVTPYRHQLVNIESEFNSRETTNAVDYIDLNLKVATTGLGAGFKVTDNFSLGFSVGFAQLEYNMLNNKTDPGAGGLFAVESVDSSDSAEQYVASLLWNPVGELNIGLVYRYGPKFDTTKFRYEDNNADGDFELVYASQNKLKIPDVIGLGLAYRFAGALTLALDVDYVEYSDLLDDLTFEAGAGLNPSDFEIDDTFELHLGIEYVFAAGDLPFALRAGYFYRPDHRIVYTGSDPNGPSFLTEYDEDEHIFSAGFGFVVGEHLQMDFAAVGGEFIKEGIFSIVYRF